MRALVASPRGSAPDTGLKTLLPGVTSDNAGAALVTRCTTLQRCQSLVGYYHRLLRPCVLMTPGISIRLMPGVTVGFLR